MIVLSSVSKWYPNGARPALIDVSAEIGAGEFVFLVGPSGSGKSTLLRLLLREERATSGQVVVAGRDVARIADRRVPQLRRIVGCVFQDFRLLPNRTVAANVAFALDVVGRPRHVVRSVVPEVLELVGLGEKADRYPDELSGGEQQRVAIARAFAGRPRVLLADEPTGNLDPATSIEIMSLLDAVHRAGTTVIMATHNASLVDAMRRRVLELGDGALIRDEADGRYDQTVPQPLSPSATLPPVVPPPPAVPPPLVMLPPAVPAPRGVPAPTAAPARPAGQAPDAERSPWATLTRSGPVG
ncbi:cell division ATP-binding protein FtsE [Candidatus Frankia alpina]|uniref:Cell division ATP-binding protein FtsE n=1 Tax=Candidatus Frankia alpina TaxID=2699483 RepID=A0A4S5EQG2_9ACTN|nr:cell division ATP-binding protein FtsE [Candidatus Frankia alpina]THJ74591.1 cell division ATP-binding protein FtsE [Candidatus Frankia alpina]